MLKKARFSKLLAVIAVEANNNETININKNRANKMVIWSILQPSFLDRHIFCFNNKNNQII